MPNVQYVANNKGRSDGRNLLTGGHFVTEPEPPRGHAEFPKYVRGVSCNDAEEEQLVLASDDDAETLRVKLSVRRGQAMAAKREAEIARLPARLEFPKFITRPDGRAIVVHSAAEEEAMMLGATGPAITYCPSQAAREALAAAVADGVGDESAIIDKAVIAWAKWRGSAMKPGQRPPRKRAGAANDGAPADGAPVA